MPKPKKVKSKASGDAVAKLEPQPPRIPQSLTDLRDELKGLVEMLEDISRKCMKKGQLLAYIEKLQSFCRDHDIEYNLPEPDGTDQGTGDGDGDEIVDPLLPAVAETKVKIATKLEDARVKVIKMLELPTFASELDALVAEWYKSNKSHDIEKFREVVQELTCIYLVTEKNGKRSYHGMHKLRDFVLEHKLSHLHEMTFSLESAIALAKIVEIALDPAATRADVAGLGEQLMVHHKEANKMDDNKNVLFDEMTETILQNTEALKDEGKRHNREILERLNQMHAAQVALHQQTQQELAVYKAIALQTRCEQLQQRLSAHPSYRETAPRIARVLKRIGGEVASLSRVMLDATEGEGAREFAHKRVVLGDTWSSRVAPLTEACVGAVELADSLRVVPVRNVHYYEEVVRAPRDALSTQFVLARRFVVSILTPWASRGDLAHVFCLVDFIRDNAAALELTETLAATLCAKAERHFMLETAKDLAAMAARGWFHRDVKEANFFFYDEAQSAGEAACTLKLGDLELVCKVGDPYAPVALVGTSGYWAPELVEAGSQGVGSVGPAVNVYAWGKMFKQRQFVQRDAQLAALVRDCTARDYRLRPSAADLVAHAALLPELTSAERDELAKTLALADKLKATAAVSKDDRTGCVLL